MDNSVSTPLLTLAQSAACSLMDFLTKPPAPCKDPCVATSASPQPTRSWPWTQHLLQVSIIFSTGGFLWGGMWGCSGLFLCWWPLSRDDRLKGPWSPLQTPLRPSGYSDSLWGVWLPSFATDGFSDHSATKPGASSLR